MSKTYERPTIIPHGTGLANKFGRGRTRQVQREIDGVSVAELKKEHGSPLFVFSEATLRNTIRRARRAFESRYPRVRFAWSYKTNYLDAICRVFHEEGAWAEVVSEHEYEMARRLDVPGDQILFNGPYKTRAALERAVSEGARIHLDGFDEIHDLEAIAKARKQRIPVTMRLNMDTGIQPRWSRFGFNLDGDEALTALRRIQAGGQLQLAGVHSHIGTFVLDPAAHGRAARKLAAFALRARDEFSQKVEYIDLGGGFPSNATLHAQYSPGDDANPPLEAYAESICDALLEAGFPPDDMPELILETGRALVDEAGYLISSVVGNKRLASGSRSMVIDAGLNLLFTSLWYKHRILPTTDHGAVREEVILHGPLCMNIDVIRPSVFLPPMRKGESLVIHPVGAYNVTQWMQFIRMRPAVVMIGLEGQVEVIRNGETVDDVKSLECTPSWLT